MFFEQQEIEQLFLSTSVSSGITTGAEPEQSFTGVPEQSLTGVPEQSLTGLEQVTTEGQNKPYTEFMTRLKKGSFSSAATVSPTCVSMADNNFLVESET